MMMMLAVHLRDPSTLQNPEAFLPQYFRKCQQGIQARKCSCIPCQAKQFKKRGDSSMEGKKCQTSQFLPQIKQKIECFEWIRGKEQIKKYYPFAVSGVMKPLKTQIEKWRNSDMCEGCKTAYKLWIEKPKAQLDEVAMDDESIPIELREQWLIDVIYHIRDRFMQLNKTSRCPYKI